MSAGWWTALWTILAALGACLEIIALRSPAKGDTLSETVWRYVTGRGHSSIPAPLAIAGRIAVLGFLGWLAAHFAFGVQ